MASKKAIFLDRDGTIIVDTAYPRDPERVELISGAASALAELQSLGFLLVVISNQSGIGRGLVTPAEADQIHRRMEELLTCHGVRLDAAYYCPHRPEDGCRCRKPAPELLFLAATDWDIDLPGSFMVGDKLSDSEAGKAAGCRTILLGESDTACGCADAVAADWPTVVRTIISCWAPWQPRNRPW